MLKPLPSTRWDFTTAAHLLNRAGFGGTPAEIEKLVALGPEQAVSHFVDYEKIQDNTHDPDWAKPDPDRVERFMAARSAPEEERKKMQRQEQQAQRKHMLELKRWGLVLWVADAGVQRACQCARWQREGYLRPARQLLW